MSTQYVHIIGIAPRCGNNFLFKLLTLHPDVEGGRIVGEDNLLTHSDLLVEYSQKFPKQWDVKWGNSREAILLAIGKGLHELVYPPNTDKVALVKTPGPKGIGHFFKLFPDSKIMLLTRNGPDQVESYRITFGERIEDIARMWSRGAREAIAFFGDHHQSGKALMVKYEELVRNPRIAIQEVLAFCSLDIQAYPFSKAEQLGVWGSSDQVAQKGYVDWTELEPREAGFDPLKRSASWNNVNYIRFLSVASNEMKAMNYPYPEKFDSLSFRILIQANKFVDLVYRILRKAARILKPRKS